MMNSSQVNSRTTYLQFRTEWKNVYKALSSEIRETKKIARTSRNADEQASAQSRGHYLRLRAQTMMGELEAVKAKRPSRVPEQMVA